MNPDTPLSRVYQIAGLDDRERGFNRQASVTESPEGFQVHLRYESVKITIGPVQTEEQALQGLVLELHGLGYSQMRYQRLFDGEQYLGSQEMWIDVPDPEKPPASESTWRRWFRKLLGGIVKV